MLSNTVIKGLSFSLRKLTLLKTCAYHWDSKNQRLSPKLNYIQLILYVTNTTYEVFFFVPYLLVQPNILMENSHNISKLILPSICYVGVNILITTQITYIFTGSHYESFVDKNFQFENLLSKFWTPSFTDSSFMIEVSGVYKYFFNLILGKENKLKLRPRWDYLMEYGINILELGSFGFGICVLLYVSLPTSTIANTCFHLFGTYHWSGYIFAVSLGWYSMAASTIANTNVFLVLSYLLSSTSTLKLLA